MHSASSGDSAVNAELKSSWMHILGALLSSRPVCLSVTCAHSLFPHDAEYNKAIRNYTHFDDWYLWVQMYKGTVSMPVFQSLEAYWPGLQVGLVRA